MLLNTSWGNNFGPDTQISPLIGPIHFADLPPTKPKPKPKVQVCEML